MGTTKLNVDAVSSLASIFFRISFFLSSSFFFTKMIILAVILHLICSLYAADLQGPGNVQAIFPVEVDLSTILNAIAEVKGEITEIKTEHKAEITENKAEITAMKKRVETAENKKGPKGPKGDRGPQGPRGYTGSSGTSGTSESFRCLTGYKYLKTKKDGGERATFSPSFRSTPTFHIALGGTGGGDRDYRTWYEDLSKSGVTVHTSDEPHYRFYATWMACGRY